MLTGGWRPDAENRLAELFADEVQEFLPGADISSNAFLSLTMQTSVLYDEPAEVTAGDVDLSPIITPELPSLQQENLINVTGLQEGLIRLDWSQDDPRVMYRVVTPNRVVALAHPDRPDVPVCIEELRLRCRNGAEEWTWEVWDVRDVKAPVFRIEREDSEKRRIDVTAEYTSGRTEYPYVARDGSPIFPWVLYHKQIGNCLWACGRGRELVEGTLTASALRTMWTAGVRDGAHPQRYIIDGEVSATRAVSTGEQKVGGVRYIPLNPMGILPIRSIGDKQATANQFQPAMDPKTTAEAIETFEASLAQYAGLRPSDVVRGSSTQSGYALVVKNEGLRRTRARIEPAMRIADQRLYATAAKLSNAYGRTNLPEEPAAYTIRYYDLPESADEVKGKLDVIKLKMDAGLMDQVDAFKAMNPHMTDEDAAAKVADIAASRAMLARPVTDDALGEPPVPAVPAAEMPAPAPPDAASPVAPETPAANTALNGAQVTAAKDIVKDVAAGQLPRETGVSMLVEFFNLDAARAERVMGTVGKSFKPTEPAAPAA